VSGDHGKKESAESARKNLQGRETGGPMLAVSKAVPDPGLGGKGEEGRERGGGARGKAHSGII